MAQDQQRRWQHRSSPADQALNPWYPLNPPPIPTPAAPWQPQYSPWEVPPTPRSTTSSTETRVQAPEQWLNQPAQQTPSVDLLDLWSEPPITSPQQPQQHQNYWLPPSTPTWTASSEQVTRTEQSTTHNSNGSPSTRISPHSPTRRSTKCDHHLQLHEYIHGYSWNNQNSDLLLYPLSNLHRLSSSPRPLCPPQRYLVTPLSPTFQDLQLLHHKEHPALPAAAQSWSSSHQFPTPNHHLLFTPLSPSKHHLSKTNSHPSKPRQQFTKPQQHQQFRKKLKNSTLSQTLDRTRCSSTFQDNQHQ